MIRTGTLTPVLLIILCCISCLMLFRSGKSTLVITIETDSTADEMSQIIRKQRENIKYLVAHPKVIFRCIDDEPQIQYPRYASDELTDIAMSTSEECGNSSTTDALLIVHTAANHFSNRKWFRKAYGNYNNTKPYRLKVVFLVGSVLDASMNIQLEMENREFGDTVVGSFLDTYQNLTLKAVMGLRWVATTCSDVKLLIKMDDDVVFDVRKFFTRYWHKVGNDRKHKSLHCLVWQNAHVRRTGKWKVERGLFPNASYPFPYCAGFFVVISPDLIQPLYTYGKSVDFFWIDDVFLYGMVPASIRGVHFIQLAEEKRLLAESHAELQFCRQREGRERCSIWAALTNGENEFEMEYSALVEY